MLVKLDGLYRGANVVRITTVVVVKPHGPVTLEGAVDLHFCSIGGELLVVDAESVASCIGVGKESCLQHLKTTLSQGTP